MSTIRVEQPHTKSLEEAKAAVDSFGQDLQARYGLKLDWNGQNATLKGLGASGDIAVEASRVVVQVKLGMMAKAAGIKADKVEASISKRLAAALS
ncbi:MAG: polyhydroxyalkanoic acid system family protein [Myxococcota bacterium]